MLQAWILLSGLTALLMLQLGSARVRRWAPFVGLAGQPAWLWFAVDTHAAGVLGVTLAYTAVWVIGCVKAWRTVA